MGAGARDTSLKTHGHMPVRDFSQHITDDHGYSGMRPIDILKLAELHAHMHTSGMGHRQVDTVADGTRGMERGR